MSDSADQGTGVTDHRTERAEPVSMCLKGIVIAAGIVVISASVISGEERPHPSLVDPAITKCTVCHTSLEAFHDADSSGESCLSCHTMVRKSGKTLLIVKGTRTGTSQRADHGTPVPPETSAAPPEGSSAEALPVVAGQRSGRSAPDFPPPGTVEGQGSPFLSEDSPSTGQLYAEGIAAFDTADFDRAFRSWGAMLNENPDHYALQVEVDSFLESARSTVARYRDHSLFIIVKEDLYWVYSGLYATQEMAIEALNLLPEPLRQGGAFPVAVREILPLQ